MQSTRALLCSASGSETSTRDASMFRGQLNVLQVVAGDEVFKECICDERAVVRDQVLTGKLQGVVTYPEPADTSTSNELTVVELNALQVVAGDEVFKGCISDERAVVQFQNCQMFCCTRRSAQVADSFISYQLTV